MAEGPLVLATENGTRTISMPLDSGSLYESLHKIMDKAYEAANSISDPDPWLDLSGLE